MLFIGPESDHWQSLSLPLCLLVNLIDVALACEDATSKLAEDHVGNNLLQIWELTFGPEAKLLFKL